MRGVGRSLFAAILLLMAGALNIIYGIAAIDDANFYADSTRYVFSNLSTWGWITLILGITQIVAGISLFQMRAFGRVFAIAAASVGAVGALMAVGGAHPFWALGVFSMLIIVIHGLVVLGEPTIAEETTSSETTP